MRKLLNRIFRHEQLDGDGRCPPYMHRWTLLAIPFVCRVYLHRFVGDDWAADPHDHPKRFISVGLWGWYRDLRYFPRGRLKEVVRYRAPWIRTFPATHLHRIEAADHGNVWTLVIVGPAVRPWGFVQDGRWIHWRRYVFGGKARKSC